MPRRNINSRIPYVISLFNPSNSVISFALYCGVPAFKIIARPPFLVSGCDKKLLWISGHFSRVSYLQICAK